MEHTKGPWEIQLIDEEHSGYADWKTFCVRAPNNCHLASIGHVDRFHSKDTEANARLIAAAPELLEELQQAVETMQGDPVQGVGEWQSGLFCGLEDRGITDRYEACQHGYNKALDRVQEWIIDGMDNAIAKTTK